MSVEVGVPSVNPTGLRQGQESTIKRATYDCTIYGTPKGAFDFILSDMFRDDCALANNGEPHYKVTLRVDMSELTRRQASIEIRLGMQAEVELHTGGKTALQYLLKPLHQSGAAFREQ